MQSKLLAWLILYIPKQLRTSYLKLSYVFILGNKTSILRSITTVKFRTKDPGQCYKERKGKMSCKDLKSKTHIFR